MAGPPTLPRLSKPCFLRFRQIRSLFFLWAKITLPVGFRDCTLPESRGHGYGRQTPKSLITFVASHPRVFSGPVGFTFLPINFIRSPGLMHTVSPDSA